MAIAFGGLATPPMTLRFCSVKKNVYRFCSAQTWARVSRSSNSTVQCRAVSQPRLCAICGRDARADHTYRCGHPSQTARPDEDSWPGRWRPSSRKEFARRPDLRKRNRTINQPGCILPEPVRKRALSDPTRASLCSQTHRSVSSLVSTPMNA